ncbi:MAG: hypothetical protein QOE16_593 [Microbacteriaceae bacterium]|jgi:hypothetical protein|nr:hypothetical protein [Microbacteriaceae bacterium]
MDTTFTGHHLPRYADSRNLSGRRTRAPHQVATPNVKRLDPRPEVRIGANLSEYGCPRPAAAWWGVLG